MIVNDVIGDIITKAQAQMTGVDHDKLRHILEETIGRYTFTLRDGLDGTSDVPQKIELYTANRRLDGLSEITIKNSNYHLARFANYVQKNAAAVTTADIRGYLSYLMETKKLKSSSMESEKSILKAFFTWLVDEEYIEKNPTKKIRPSKIEKRLRKSLDLEELELLRDACITPRERCIVEVFYSTGVRLDELSEIDIEDINWTDNSIKVIGKGNKERIVYFSAKAKVYLKKYIANRWRFKDGALFIGSKKPYARLGHRAIQREIDKIAKRAGLTKNVYPHLLRHTFATQGLRSGASINVIHDLLGHESLDTTLVYAQTDIETAAYEYRKHINQ